jgi:hypothetical protein
MRHTKAGEIVFALMIIEMISLPRRVPEPDMYYAVRFTVCDRNHTECVKRCAINERPAGLRRDETHKDSVDY